MIYCDTCAETHEKGDNEGETIRGEEISKGIYQRTARYIILIRRT